MIVPNKDLSNNMQMSLEYLLVNPLRVLKRLEI